MISLDTIEKNTEFAESLEAKHVLLADPEKKVADAYGVTAMGGLYSRRWNFFIDPDGVIREIDTHVDVDSAGQDIARKLGELGFPRRDEAAKEPEKTP